MSPPYDRVLRSASYTCADAAGAGKIRRASFHFKIWHMGDTGLFPDMQFISEHYKPDLVLIPIGGNFTMDHDDAAFAARTWIKPKNIVPMHYGANPIAKGTLAGFQAAMQGSSIKVIPMTEGQTIEF